MKNTLILAAAAALTGTAIVTYLLNKSKNSIKNLQPLHNSKISHHTTNVFANAKKHANHTRTSEIE